MTGTSIDGIDAALVDIAGFGLAMLPRFIRGISMELGDVQPRLRAFAAQQAMSAGDIARLMHDFAMLHVEVIRELLQGEACDLVCVHGQTVFHQPPLSWQLMQPAPIVAALGVAVVCDVRQADLARGGQGAPLTPIADWLTLGDAPHHRAVANLGGFCNITVLPPATNAPPAARVRGVRARDVCVCNQLLDGVARAVLGCAFDRDGQAALRGTPDARASDALFAMLTRQHAEGRSLGTGDELASWIGQWRGQLDPQSLAASACEALARVITAAVEGCDEVVLAGGGVHNAALVREIARHGRARVVRSDDLGVPAAYREAMAFGVLGALCQDREPISLPHVTRLPAGVAAPLAGLWAYPS